MKIINALNGESIKLNSKIKGKLVEFKDGIAKLELISNKVISIKLDMDLTAFIGKDLEIMSSQNKKMNVKVLENFTKETSENDLEFEILDSKSNFKFNLSENEILKELKKYGISPDQNKLNQYKDFKKTIKILKKFLDKNSEILNNGVLKDFKDSNIKELYLKLIEITDKINKESISGNLKNGLEKINTGEFPLDGEKNILLDKSLSADDKIEIQNNKKEFSLNNLLGSDEKPKNSGYGKEIFKKVITLDKDFLRLVETKNSSSGELEIKDLLDSINEKSFLFNDKIQVKNSIKNIINFSNIIFKKNTIISQFINLVSSDDIENINLIRQFEQMDIKEFSKQIDLIEKIEKKIKSEKTYDKKILKELLIFKDSIEYIKNINESIAYFQIPIIINEELSEFELAYKKGKRNEDEFSIYISLDTKNIGTVQAYIKMSKENINISFKFNSEIAYVEFKKIKDLLEDKISQLIEKNVIINFLFLDNKLSLLDYFEFENNDIEIYGFDMRV